MCRMSSWSTKQNTHCQNWQDIYTLHKMFNLWLAGPSIGSMYWSSTFSSMKQRCNSTQRPWQSGSMASMAKCWEALKILEGAITFPTKNCMMQAWTCNLAPHSYLLHCTGLDIVLHLLLHHPTNDVFSFDEVAVGWKRSCGRPALAG